MGGLSDFVKDVSGVNLFRDLTGATAAEEAAAQQSAAAGSALAEQRRQFDITQSNLQPFLQAAVGAEQYRRVFDPANLRPGEQERYERLLSEGRIDQQGYTVDQATGRREVVGRANGALQQFQQGIGQSPDIPQLQQFQGQAVAAPELQRFQGQAPQLQTNIPAQQLQQSIPQTQLTGFQSGAQNVEQFNAGTPELERFEFDPRAALDNPALQFQQEMGQQAMERQAGKNRLLGSGQRLIEAQRFGQGLASQFIGDEFNRQLASTQQRNQAAQQGFGNEAQRAQLRAGITGQQFGQDVTGNQLANQLAAQRFGQGLQAGQFANQAAQQQFQQGLAGAQFGNQAQQQGFQNQLGLNDLANQQAIQQQQLQRQQLSDEQALAQQEQNRLLTQYGLSSDAFNQRMNRLAGLVDVGRGAGGTLAQAGQQNANSVSNLLQAQGAANAAGTLGSANAITGGLTQMAGLAAFGGAFNPQNRLATTQQFGTAQLFGTATGSPN